MHSESCPVMIPLPPLSDEAVAELHGFLHHIRDLFEFHYGDQIYQYHKNQRKNHHKNQQSTDPTWPATQDDPF